MFNEIKDQERKKYKIQDELQRIRRGYKQEIFDYEYYQSLRPLEKSGLRREWEDYYEEVRTTMIYVLFKMMGKAFRENKPQMVQEVREMNALIREAGQESTVAKPAFRDPQEYQNVWIYEYFDSLLSQKE